MTDISLQIGLAGALIILIGIETARFVRGRRRERALHATIQHLRDDVQALCTGAANVGKHLAGMEQKIRRLSERQDQVELRDPAQQAYGHAIRLAQRGADIDELIASCGLARGEAELLMRLHQGNEKH